jgi:hypothetical protein
MQAIIYQCPNCKSTVEVPEDMISERIVCPNPQCREPFELQVPHGRAVGSHDASEAPRGQFSIDRNNVHDERTVLKVHPAVFRRHPFQTLGIAVLVIGGMVLSLGLSALGDGTMPIWLGLTAVAAGAVWAGYWMIKKIGTTLTITSRRSIVRRGIVSRRTSEVQHDDVRNMQVNQGIFERLLLVGDIAISSAGQDEMEIHVQGVSRPARIAEEVRGHQHVGGND